MKLLLDFLRGFMGKEMVEYTDANLWMLAKDAAKLRKYKNKYAVYLTRYRKDDPRAEKNKPQHITIKELEQELVEILDWSKISSTARMDMPFIERYQDEIDWERLAINPLIPKLEVYERFKDKMNVNAVVQDIPLSEDFLQSNIDSIDPFTLYKYQSLSEAFIERNYAADQMYVICGEQKLSVSFIREHEEDVHWKNLSANEKITRDIIDAYKDRLDWYWLIKNKKVSYEMILENIEKIDVEKCQVVIGRCISEDEYEKVYELIQLKKAFKAFGIR